MTTLDENGGQKRWDRVKRLKQAVGDIQDAQVSMEESLRTLSLARLIIKRALADVVSDLATLSE